MKKTYEEMELLLGRYYKSTKEHERARLKLQELMLDKRYPSAIRYTDMPKRTLIPSDLSDYIVKLNDALQEVNSLRQQMDQEYDNVLKAIECLPGTTLEEQKERYLLKLRYLKLFSWKKICAELNYSRRHADRIRRRAINRLLEYKQM